MRVIEVGEFGLCNLLFIFGFRASRDERNIKKNADQVGESYGGG